MPLFRVTKKLATALKLRPLKHVVDHGNPEHEWFADLFYVEGKKAVIWVHRPTLLTFARTSVTAAVLREFHALFRYEFRNLIASLSLAESLNNRFGVYTDEAYATTNDRRVVGSMLDYRKMFQDMVSYDGGLGAADVTVLNGGLNETPMSVLGGDSAVRRVRALIAANDRLH